MTRAPAGVLVASATRELRLIGSWSKREIHSKYRQSSLSLLWAIAQPLSVIAIYLMVFNFILRVDSSGLPYLSFMIAGLAAWRYFSIGLNQAGALVTQANLMGKVYFRREVIPLSGCLSGLIDLGIGTAALLGIAAVQGIEPTWTVAWLPVIYLPLVVYTAAAAVLLAVVAVFARDLVHVMPTIAQLLFLSTPIMYPVDQLPAGLWFLAELNPIALLVEAVRDVTLRGIAPSGTALALNLVLSVGLLVAAIAYCRSIEHRIVDVA